MVNQLSQVRAFATSWLRVFLGCLVLATSLNATASAQVPAQGGVVEAKFIDGYIFVPVLASTEVFELPVHIMIDLSAPDVFAGFANSLAGIQYGEGETTLKLLADGFRLEIDANDVLSLPGYAKPAQQTFATSARYDRELNNEAVLAVLGYPALEGYRIELNPAASTVTLTPASEGDLSVAEGNFEYVINGVEVESGRMYVPVSYGRGQSSRMLINTTSYHTFLDKDQAIALGAPEGDLKGVTFGRNGQGPSISSMTALYPYDFDKLDEVDAAYEQMRTVMRVNGGAIGDAQDPVQGDILLRSGMNLLNGFMVELNPSQGYMALARQVDSRYSEGDAAFYAAAGTSNVPGIQAYFEDFAGDRNVEEAGEVMFDLVLEQELGGDLLVEAVESGLEGVEPRNKSTYARGFADQLMGNDELRDAHPGTIIAVTEMALKYIGRSLNPGQRTQLQFNVGELHYEAGRAREAWKMYLSAAFNRDPALDDIVRLRLGRVYEDMERYRRAYGSFQRVATSRASGNGTPELSAPDWVEAIESLERIGEKLDADDPLLMEELSLQVLKARAVSTAGRIDEGEALLLSALDRRDELNPEDLQVAEESLEALRRFRAREAERAEAEQ